MPLIWKPSIKSVTITPNPVNANTSYIISVSVEDIQVEVEQVVIYSGITRAGEEGDIG